MDSQDEEDLDAELDAELDAWFDKMAVEQGLDPNDLRAAEVEVLQRWQQNPTPEDFEFLYNAHQPLINRAASQFAVTIPKTAFKSSLLRGYVNALQTFDPTQGAQFKTHFFRNWVGRTWRYLQRYSNVGRIPEDRSGMINLMQAREQEMKDTLGRQPSDLELADDMMLAAQDIAQLKNRKITPKVVGTLRKELRKDLIAESEHGAAEVAGDSNLRRKIVFLHGSLNPEQQLVLEHTFDGFGKPIVEDDEQLAQMLDLSPQKVRAIKGQIKKKVDRFW